MSDYRPLSDDARTIAAAVREAIDIPHAATVGEHKIRAKILDRRVDHVQVFVQSLTKSHDVDLAWQVEYLRERLAEHPPVGYVTVAQAHERLAAGDNPQDGGAS